MVTQLHTIVEVLKYGNVKINELTYVFRILNRIYLMLNISEKVFSIQERKPFIKI